MKAPARGVFVHPTRYVMAKEQSVFLLTRKRIRLSQSQKMLMTIQFPENLVFASDFRIQMIDLSPVAER